MNGKGVSATRSTNGCGIQWGDRQSEKLRRGQKRRVATCLRSLDCLRCCGSLPLPQHGKKVVQPKCRAVFHHRVDDELGQTAAFLEDNLRRDDSARRGLSSGLGEQVTMPGRETLRCARQSRPL